jgi:hypothetical protein
MEGFACEDGFAMGLVDPLLLMRPPDLEMLVEARLEVRCLE